VTIFFFSESYILIQHITAYFFFITQPGLLGQLTGYIVEYCAVQYMLPGTRLGSGVPQATQQLVVCCLSLLVFAPPLTPFPRGDSHLTNTGYYLALHNRHPQIYTFLYFQNRQSEVSRYWPQMAENNFSTVSAQNPGMVSLQGAHGT
jgi:hypothetical protein